MTFDAIVIGGGVAGLAAATTIAESGGRVCVVEARPTLGGRAFSYRDPVTGDIVDNGQHILMGCYRESFRFLRRIGTADKVRLQPSLYVPMIDRAGARTALSCPALPSPWHLLGGVLEWDALSWRDRLSVFRLAPAIRTAQAQLRGKTAKRAAAPGETIDAWLIRNGQSERIREMLWEPLALAAMNQPAAEAGAEMFARVLAQAFGDDPRDAALALPRVPLSALYVDPAVAYIESHGGVMRTNAKATVLVSGGRVEGVEIKGGERFHAPEVVSSVPWHTLTGLFGAVPAVLEGVAARAGRMKSYPIVTVNLWFDRTVVDDPLVGLPGREMQWVFDKRAVFDGVASHLSLVSSGARALVAMSNEDVVNLAVAELTAALPRVSGATLRHATVIRERHSTFSVAPGEPERPSCDTGLEGFVLAGDWTDTSLPGTIESAALSGHRAAAKVVSNPRSPIANPQP